MENTTNGKKQDPTNNPTTILSNLGKRLEAIPAWTIFCMLILGCVIVTYLISKKHTLTMDYMKRLNEKIDKVEKDLAGIKANEENLEAVNRIIENLKKDDALK